MTQSWQLDADTPLPAIVAQAVAVAVDERADVRRVQADDAVVIPQQAARRIDVRDENFHLVRCAVAVRVAHAEDAAEVRQAAERAQGITAHEPGPWVLPKSLEHLVAEGEGALGVVLFPNRNGEGNYLWNADRNNVAPRFGFAYRVKGSQTSVVRGGFGMFTGPGQTEDLIQPAADSDRISTTISSGSALAYPLDPSVAVNNFVNNPNNRSYQPRAYANEYTLPEKVYQYTASIQQELPGNFTATAAYVGAQGRDLFLRTITNKITQVVTNPNPANAAFVIRQFSIVQRDANGTITGGMIPKVESAAGVVESGVEGVIILDGRVPHSVLLELLTPHGVGTRISRAGA